MNNCTFVGRLTADGQLTKVNTKNGISNVCNFTVAINDDKEHPLFVRGTLWNKHAESLVAYMSKGAVVSMTGPLTVRTYVNEKTKEPGTDVSIRVDSFRLEGGKNEEVKKAEKDVTLPEGFVPNYDAPTPAPVVVEEEDNGLPF